jgi:tRNA-dihydrouridine synthase
LPVSIKTRLGFSAPAIKEWLGFLASLKPAAITIHGRTYAQGYAGSANWDLIKEAALLIKSISPETIVLGNGDVQDRKRAEEKVAAYGVDGCLIGRAALGNPFVFLPKNPPDLPPSSLALEHARLYEQCFSSLSNYSFLPVRKHLAWYCRGFTNASSLRTQLMTANSAADVAALLNNFS